MPNILEMAKRDMEDYGKEVLTERAIPDFRDGLKPVHRRILWAMYELGLKHTGGTKKCARIVGDTIGKFHPHGDASTYQALIGMAQKNSPEPTVYGQGNFGDIEDSAAAYRYTEAKLSAFSDKYLLDPDYLAVTPMVLNYDETEKEPIFLPAKLPGPFLFGTEGIAIGCSNLVPTFSRESVTDLVIKAMSGEEITPALFASTLKFKFTYGGRCVSSKRELKEYFETGFAKLSFSCNISQGKKDNVFTIDTMCPRMKPSRVETSLSGIKAIRSLDYVRDSKNPRWFEITLKKSADEKEVLAKIRKELTTSLNLQTYITIRKKKEVMFKRTTPINLLKAWIKWRLSFEKKVIERLIGLEEIQIQKFDWLIWAFNHLALIKDALESKDPDKYLIKKGKIEEEAASWILSQQIRRLARIEVDAIKEKRKERERQHKILIKDLGSEKRLVKRVIGSIE